MFSQIRDTSAATQTFWQFQSLFDDSFSHAHLNN